MKKPRILVLLAAVLLVTACAQTATPGATPTPATTPTPSAVSLGGGELAGTRWQVDKLADQAPVAGTTITASFDAEGAVSGSGGCNRYRTGFTVTGDTIKVDEAIASTMMACDEAIMAQEAAYFTALSAAHSFAIAGDQLTLSDAQGVVLVTFVAQSQDLAGTSWAIVAYNNGQQAVVSVIEGTTPTLEFAADGTISGSGGCNRITGSFAASDGKIGIGELARTLMECSEPAGAMDQENALVAALESAATYTIEGDRLEMRTAEDAIAIQATRS